MATKSIELLTEEFNKLPSIGRKTAQRLAFAILEMEKEEVERFAKALIEVKEKVKKCAICGNFSEEETCDICKDEERDIQPNNVGPSSATGLSWRSSPCASSKLRRSWRASSELVLRR